MCEAYKGFFFFHLETEAAVSSFSRLFWKQTALLLRQIIDAPALRVKLKVVAICYRNMKPILTLAKPCNMSRVYLSLPYLNNTRYFVIDATGDVTLMLSLSNTLFMHLRLT
jgi:hypothetical protein